jgi:hypothetical protein
VSQSRPQRWSDAVKRAQQAKDDLESALGDLKGLQDEYEEWKGNLPENLQGSALYEKLEAVTELDLDMPDLSVVDEAESAELPRGFGRD